MLDKHVALFRAPDATIKANFQDWSIDPLVVMRLCKLSRQYLQGFDEVAGADNIRRIFKADTPDYSAGSLPADYDSTDESWIAVN